MTTTRAQSSAAESPVLARLSRLDRLLPLWIVLTIAAGLVLGRLVPSLHVAVNSVFQLLALWLRRRAAREQP